MFRRLSFAVLSVLSLAGVQLLADPPIPPEFVAATATATASWWGR
jgi:hypothetical protein